MLLSIILVAIVTRTGAYYYCNESYQISNKNKSVWKDYINLNAYKCAYNKDELSAYDINCYGSHSCENISDLYTGNIECHGDGGCKNSFNITADDIGCYGGGSCSHVNTISGRGWSGTLNCVGDQSCAYSSINNIYGIYAKGAYSLYNSIINSNGHVYIYLNGYFSGYNLTVICQESDTCEISCENNGCYNTKIICKNNSICDNSIENIGNNNNVKLIFDSIKFSKNMDDLCNLPNSLTYDNYPVTKYMPYIPYNISNNTNITNLCCRSYDSCFGTHIITATNNIINIVCSGYYSCWGTYIYNSNNNNNNNSILCSAPVTCSRSYIYGNPNGNIYCIGSASCISSNIYYGNILYCGGYDTCYPSDIYSISNIYFLGYIFEDTISLHVTRIYSNGINKMNVYFGTNDLNTYIFCTKSDLCNIYCQSQNGCNNVKAYCNENSICTIYCNQINNINCPYYNKTNKAKIIVYNGNINNTNNTLILSNAPTQPPSNSPSIIPSNSPSSVPTTFPSMVPSIVPSNSPSYVPSKFPSMVPSIIPSNSPSFVPTTFPSMEPSISTQAPSFEPTISIIIYKNNNNTIVVIILCILLVCCLIIVSLICYKYKMLDNKIKIITKNLPIDMDENLLNQTQTGIDGVNDVKGVNDINQNNEESKDN